MHSPRPPVPPLLVLAFGVLAASTAAIFIRYAQGQHAPSLVIAAYRLSLATLFLAPWAFLRQRSELRRLTRRDLALALLAGFFLALHFATWISSLEYTTVASSVVLVTTTPLWVALLTPFVLRERIHRNALLGMGMALMGGVVVALSDRGEGTAQNPLLGDGLALAGALMAAGYILIGRRLRARVSLGSYIFVVYGMAALVLVGLAVGSGAQLWGYPLPAYGWFVLLALVPQLLGHSSFNWALGYLSAAYVSVTLLGEPIGSTVLAYLLLGEAPGAVKLVGAILILVGIYITSKSERS